MNLSRRQICLGTVAAVTAAAYRLIPADRKDNKKAPPSVNLEQIVPSQFGLWRMVDAPIQAVNPQTQAILDRLYSQILARTYVHQSGYAIMLSLAYGADQRGSLEAHKPEVCYPAQGFTVDSTELSALETGFGTISTKRLATHLGSRNEPLIYWFTLGSHNVQSRLSKRIVELKMAITGQIPDGLLFRVSSIDNDLPRAWERQAEFIRDLLANVTPEARTRLTGL